MRPWKYKTISWLLAFAIGVASTLIVQSCMRPIPLRSVAQFQKQTPQSPLLLDKIEPKTESETAPTIPERIISLKLRNHSISEKAESFYTLKADYPQIADLNTKSARRFNRWIEDLIFRYITHAREQGRFMIHDLQRKGETKWQEEGLTIGYVILFASPGIISISFTHSYMWTFHPIDSFESINYDLKAGKPLQLEDLFQPKAKYLQALSKSSRIKLLELYQLSEIDSWMEKGTAPIKKNFKAWNITPEGIVISFGDYQIGPYAMGKSEVTIPFKDLEKSLKRRDLLTLAEH